MEVGVAFDLRWILGCGVTGGDEFAEGFVVGVDVRAEETGEEIALHWGGSGQVAIAVAVGHALLGGVDGCAGAVESVLAGVARRDSEGVLGLAVAELGVLLAEEGFFLGFQVLREVVDQGSHCGFQGDVVEDQEDKENNLEDQWADGDLAVGSSDGEQTDQADDEKVAAHGEMLQTLDEDFALRVDVGVGYIEHVVAVGEVEEEQGDTSKAKNQRLDAGVGDCFIQSV